MTRIFFLYFLYVCTVLSIQAQHGNYHLYTEINLNDDDQKIRYGNLEYPDDDKVSKNGWDAVSRKTDFLDSLSYKMNLLPASKQNVLIYIHGMWGHNWSYLGANHKIMHDQMWMGDSNPYGMVITIIWHCGPIYHDNVDIAIQSGNVLAPLIKNIHEIANTTNAESKTSYVLHSMGNRVFQGLWSSSLADNIEYRADNIIMAGADLETNVFEDDQPFGHIENLAKEVLVYVHNNDRTLSVSKLLNKKDRLGLHGIEDITAVSDHITQVDVSVITDNEDIPASISNHRYFYMSPTVRKDLVMTLNGADESDIPRRKKLKHKRSLMLEPVDNQ